MLAAAANRGRPLMTRRDDLPQMTLLVACCLTLLALPFVTTYNDLLTAGAIRLGIAAPLQAVSPTEGRMVVALLQVFGVHAATAGSQIVVWDGGGQATNLFISWNCIGWQSLVLLGASFVLGLRGLSAEARLQVFTAGLLGTILVNLIRVALVCALAATAGRTPAVLFHDYAGTLMIVGWLFAFWFAAQRWMLAAADAD
jgi:exosortase/archaeosortase family protein